MCLEFTRIICPVNQNNEILNEMKVDSFQFAIMSGETCLFKNSLKTCRNVLFSIVIFQSKKIDKLFCVITGHSNSTLIILDVAKSKRRKNMGI